MRRLFREHELRAVRSLDGVWDFAFLGDADPDAVDISAIRFDDRMPVPGCFDATPRYAARRGLAAYRTRVRIEDPARRRLVFGAAQHWCRVFADGERVAEHGVGFTAFAADIPKGGLGEVEIVALVDNRFDLKRSPLHMEYFDWHHYGGLSRPVELHRLGRLWMDWVRVATLDVASPKVALRIQYGADDPPGRVELEIACDGEVVLAEGVELRAASGHIERVLELPGAAPWSPDAPNLHTLRIRLGGDDLIERFGLRQVRAEGRNILINGRPIRLLGVCRHELHPQFGHALPEMQLVADAQIIKDMGCNFVRGGHYPNDPRFLDLCDEIGLCFWSEGVAWQPSVKHLSDPAFVSAQLAHAEEMVAEAYNHPALIMWGALNEGQSHFPDARPGYEKILGRLRELDPTRPITWASNHPTEDLCLDLVDVISINTYPGWYSGTLEDVTKELDRIAAHMDQSGRANKPLLISEIGADGIFGCRDWNDDRWSEPYQAKLLDLAIRHMFEKRDRFCGLTIWVFSDFRSSSAPSRILMRPRAFNNKGLVDEYRRPKLAVRTVTELFKRLLPQPARPPQGFSHPRQDATIRP